MTAFPLRSVAILALTAVFAGGSTGCTAEPRYPVEVGQAAGGGFEPLQPRYPVRFDASADGGTVENAPLTPVLTVAQADSPSRAAPVGAVAEESLPPVNVAPVTERTLPAKADAAPPIDPREQSLQAASGDRPGAATASAVQTPLRPAAPVTLAPVTPAPARVASTRSGAPFLQSGVGAGPPRFTIGAPVPPAPILAQPAVPIAPPVYARPIAPPVYAQPSAPPVYARPSTPPPVYAPPTYARPSVQPPSYAPPTYARPALPAPSYGAPTYARPSPLPRSYAAPQAYNRPSPSVPSYAPPTYARPSAPVSAYARPSTPYGSTPYTSSPYASAPSGGPHPYTSLLPQGPRPPRGAFRSAGVRSTPGDPGMAPQPLTLPPLLDASPPSTTEAAALGQGRFAWPLRGVLISGYGDKAGGQRNDGLNIAASIGDSVKAAAAGEVVYAGDLVPGSGNLVLVKHPGGWVTAYAHLSRIEVKMRDPIAQGQEIGQAGQSGGVDRPQLHFEIRYARNPQLKAAPVDPAALLPRG